MSEHLSEAGRWSDLAAKLIIGTAPALGAALGGPAGGALGETIGRMAAGALGVEPTPEAVTAAAARDDAAPKLQAALSPLVALYAQENATLAALDKGDYALFKDGWRPALCWLAGLAWAQALIVAPWIDAFGYKMPAIPTENLTTFTTVLLTVLGLGHTAKHVFGAGGLALKGGRP